jgi:hypothetical protein
VVILSKPVVYSFFRYRPEVLSCPRRDFAFTCKGPNTSTTSNTNPSVTMAVVCNPNWRDSTWAFYRYVPSVAAAIIFCLLFLVSTLLHSWQMWKTKAWFLTALVVGCLCTSYSSTLRQKKGHWSNMSSLQSSSSVSPLELHLPRKSQAAGN